MYPRVAQAHMRGSCMRTGVSHDHVLSLRRICEGVACGRPYHVSMVSVDLFTCCHFGHQECQTSAKRPGAANLFANDTPATPTPKFLQSKTTLRYS